MFFVDRGLLKDVAGGLVNYIFLCYVAVFYRPQKDLLWRGGHVV